MTSTDLPPSVTAGGPGFDRLAWRTRFVDALPRDSIAENRRRQVADAAYSLVEPTSVSSPTLIGWSPDLASELGLPTNPSGAERTVLADVLGGNLLVDGMQPYAARYGGHQFGNWAGQLGDGRAIALGEVELGDGTVRTLQLKGSGPTPYSRSGDGRAVLRSSVREFLCSEAMHHLGVPTTRALSLVLTGDRVVRDMFYDGNPEPELGAIVCRVAPSFVRFGNFQLPAYLGELDHLRRLIEFTIREDFAHLLDPTIAGSRLDASVIESFFDEVCVRTADLMVHWQRVGFVHGVMNTDNLSILGLTIDYGPYGWLENFDPDWTPNTTDAGQRRYRYAHQPNIALWNLFRLAEALHQVTERPEPLQASLDRYTDVFRAGHRDAFRAKLGLVHEHEGDDELLDEVFTVMSSAEIDMTIFFRSLPGAAEGAGADDELVAAISEAFYVPEQIVGDVRESAVAWLRRWRERVLTDGLTEEERRSAMDAVNPRYVLRNYLAQLAIDAADQGDNSVLDELLDTLRYPYTDQPGRDRFAERRPDWARTRAGCSMLSCSS